MWMAFLGAEQHPQLDRHALSWGMAAELKLAQLRVNPKCDWTAFKAISATSGEQ